MISSIRKVDVTINWACCRAMSPIGFITIQSQPVSDTAIRARAAARAARERKTGRVIGFVARVARRGKHQLRFGHECSFIDPGQPLDILSKGAPGSPGFLIAVPMTFSATVTLTSPTSPLAGAHGATPDHSPHEALSAPGDIAVGVVIGRASEYFDFFVFGIASVLVFPAVFFPFADRLHGTLYDC